MPRSWDLGFSAICRSPEHRFPAILILALIIVCGCGSAAVPPGISVSSPARAIAVRIDGGDIFSDLDESADALTRIACEPSSTDSAVADASIRRFKYRIVTNPTLGYEYCGVAIPIAGRNPEIDLAGLKTMSFEAKSEDGGAIDLVQIVTTNRKRDAVALATFGAMGREWKRFDVPFEAFAAATADDWKNIQRFAFHFARQGGTVEIRNVTFNDSAVPVPSPFPIEYASIMKPAKRQIEASWLAWIYEFDAAEPELLRVAKPSGPITLLYYVGSVDPDGVGFRKAGLDRKLMKKWMEAGYRFEAMIDGGGGNEWATLPAGKYLAIAESVAAYLAGYPEFSGVHFDIEPYATRHSLFFAMVRKSCPDLIVSAAVGRWDRHLLDVCDYVALMGYDFGSTPEAAGAEYARIYPDFAADCDKRGTPFFIGIPAIATGHEYEMKHNYRAGKDTEVMPHKMEEFLDAALDVVVADSIRRLPQYRGIAIWGLLHEPVGKPWGFHTYPWKLKPEVLDRLREFNRGGEK